MKDLIFCIFGLLFFSSLPAQTGFMETNIWLSPKSELAILGSTNVNSFTCRFNTITLSGERTVHTIAGEDILRFRDLDLKLVASGFDCGNRKMNEDFKDLLKADEYPSIVLKIDHVELISEHYVKVFITVELAGKKKKYDLPVQISENQLKGKFSINIRDFGLEPPKKALGLIEVNEMIEVNFDLNLKK